MGQDGKIKTKPALTKHHSPEKPYPGRYSSPDAQLLRASEPNLNDGKGNVFSSTIVPKKSLPFATKTLLDAKDPLNGEASNTFKQHLANADLSSIHENTSI